MLFIQAIQLVNCCFCTTMPTSDNDSHTSDEHESGSGSSKPDMELNSELFIPISVLISTAGVSKEDLIRVHCCLIIPMSTIY